MFVLFCLTALLLMWEDFQSREVTFLIVFINLVYLGLSINNMFYVAIISLFGFSLTWVITKYNEVDIVYFLLTLYLIVLSKQLNVLSGWSILPAVVMWGLLKNRNPMPYLTVLLPTIIILLGGIVNV